MMNGPIYLVLNRLARRALILLLGCCGHTLVAAEEFVSRLFADHMVMQRDMPVPVWGWAEPSEQISVTIDQQTLVATADAAGKWMVRLAPMAVGAPRHMTVKGSHTTAEIADILLGEVWICSGQSNMAWPLKQAKNGKDEVAAADHPEIRLFSVPFSMAPKGPQEHLPKNNPKVPSENVWQVCSPTTAGEFSAVGYFFARDLQPQVQVPIGLISNAVGGSFIEAWISHDAFIADPDFRAVAEYWDGLANFAENTPEGKKQMAELIAQYEAKQVEAKAQGQPPLWPPTYGGPLKNSAYAGTLSNAVLNPLMPYAIKGVLWYQGEAQYMRMFEYRDSFPLLIEDWRKRWGQGDFPFLFVQLPNFGPARPEPDSGGSAIIRESQLMALHEPHTAMAVSIDVGEANSIHPLNKQDVGHRLAVAARGTVYGEKIVYSGPLYRAMKVEGSSIRISFDHVGSGLDAKGGELKQFTIAGADMKFVWATAQIDGDTVVVHADGVPTPVAVRYAWASNPDGCNLWNRDGLPASPFRTDVSAPGERSPFFKAKLKKPFTLMPEK